MQQDSMPSAGKALAESDAALVYPALLEPAGDGRLVVSSRDVPQALGQIEPGEDAAAEAREMLLIALRCFLRGRLPIPEPTALRAGETPVTLSADFARRIRAHNAGVRAWPGDQA